MRILFVNHTSNVSGAERSLLDLIRSRHGADEVLLACPDGELTLRAREMGVTTVTLAFPEFGFGTGSLDFMRIAWRMAATALRLRRLATLHRADVVRAASTRAGLVLAACAFSRPTRVVDIRDVLPRGLKSSLVGLALRFSADELVFNSRSTREWFGPTSPARDAVAYPSVDLRPFLDLPHISVRDHDAPVLGVVGQITPWKGQDDAIRILAAVRGRFPGATLRVVGRTVFTGPGVSHDNEAFSGSLRALSNELGVSDAVDFTGEIEDLRPVYVSLDVLLCPSWHEPFGRVVAEAMAAGVPVVATSVGGPAELIEDGVSGLLAPPRAPEAWIEPVCRVLENAEVARGLAAAGRTRIAEVLSVAVPAADANPIESEVRPASAGRVTG